MQSRLKISRQCYGDDSATWKEIKPLTTLHQTLMMSRQTSKTASSFSFTPRASRSPPPSNTPHEAILFQQRQVNISLKKINPWRTSSQVRVTLGCQRSELNGWQRYSRTILLSHCRRLQFLEKQSRPAELLHHSHMHVPPATSMWTGLIWHSSIHHSDIFTNRNRSNQQPRSISTGV